MVCLVVGTGVVGCSYIVRGGGSLSLRSETLFFPKVLVVRMGEANGLLGSLEREESRGE